MFELQLMLNVSFELFLSTGVQIAQFEDVKFEAASLLSELYCQQVSLTSPERQTSDFCETLFRSIELSKPIRSAQIMMFCM